MTPLFASGIVRRPQTRFVVDTLGASTLTVPTWATSMDVIAWGGGGAGGGPSTNPGGGTGGSRAAKTGVTVTPGSTLTVFVGDGGKGSGQNPTASAQASHIEMSAGNRLTAAGGALYAAYAGAASGGTGAFASPTLSTGETGGTGSTVFIPANPPFNGVFDFTDVSEGGAAGGPGGGAGGTFIDTDDDDAPDTLVSPERPGGGGMTTPEFRVVNGVTVNSGGFSDNGAPGRVVVQFYP